MEKHFIQSNLKVNPVAVIEGEIRRYEWEFKSRGRMIRKVANIVITDYVSEAGVECRCHHLDNDYWNTVIQRSGFRLKDWTEVN